VVRLDDVQAFSLQQDHAGEDLGADRRMKLDEAPFDRR
jgi:hypothetical protein